jgi:hypothetical protein
LKKPINVLTKGGIAIRSAWGRMTYHVRRRDPKGVEKSDRESP